MWLLHELFKGAVSVEQHEQSERMLSDFIGARIQESRIGIDLAHSRP
jgi:hypothetical protein